jgi:hypothetical protein
MRQPLGERPRLARARTGDDQQRTISMLGGGALLWIEGGTLGSSPLGGRRLGQGGG